MTVTHADLAARYDLAAGEARVRAVIERAAGDGESLLRFLGRYISWNGHFGSGVATLAGAIGRSRAVFVDRDEPIAACADRSVHVASYFFDAARDEFDDSATPHRDSHRSLAQATLKGLVSFLGLEARADALLTDPPWLEILNGQVYSGYGLGLPEERLPLFGAMGFHLGSEILADGEFSVLDRALRRGSPALVDYLLNHRVEVAGAVHPAYYWIGIHSGHGGGVEAEHFDWAVAGVRAALEATPEKDRAACIEAALAGFDSFAALHGRFFSHVLEP